VQWITFAEPGQLGRLSGNYTFDINRYCISYQSSRGNDLEDCMKMNQIAGVVVPVVTPVDSQDRVDEEAYRGFLRHLIEAGVHGIFVGGSAGEGSLLTFVEWERMCEIAFEECQGKVHLLGGTLDTSTKRVIERAKALAAIGYENFVVLPTFYLKLTVPDEHLRLFGECKEALGDLNMVVYNLPSISGSSVPVEVMCDMTQRGWITCCKDTSEDMTYFSRLLSEAGPLGLEVLMGSERHAAEALLMGARGIVPVCANFEPWTFVAAYESREDTEAMEKYKERILVLGQNVLVRPRLWVSGAKYAVATMGFGSGKPVYPGEPLSLAEQRDIDSFLSNSERPGVKT
jgi:4-hydroxy-tetrahydrodipicolinate synthase